MKKLGPALMIVGIAGIAFFLGIDLIRIGKSGIQAFQVLGIQAGVLLIVFGWGVFQENRAIQDQSFGLKPFFAFLEQIPVIVWLFSGFLLTYFLLFVLPVFLNNDLRLYYFINYIPDKYPIGVDIRTLTEYAYKWYVTGQSPYIDGVIPSPPFYNIFMSTFVLLGYPKIYYLSLTISFFAFFGITLSYVLAVYRIITLDYAAIFFFLVTGLFSYGMLFELERGQLNLFVMLLAVLAVVLFHYRPSFRLLAYLLFSAAVQIKIFPVFLIFLFVEDWHAWKQNIKRFLGLGLLNLAALFVMGYQEFVNFLASISNRFGTTFRWVGNHSIYNFAWGLTHGEYGIISPQVSGWLNQYISVLRIILMIYVLACVFIIIVKAYREHTIGLNRFLLVASTIAAMLIPSESQDYKLSFLAPILAIFFADKTILDVQQRFFAIGCVFLSALSYSVSLFPFKYRPVFLQNSFPLLFVLLTVTTWLAILGKNKTQVLQ